MKAAKTKEVRLSPMEDLFVELKAQDPKHPHLVPLMMLQDMWDMGRKREAHQGLFLLQQKLR